MKIENQKKVWDKISEKWAIYREKPLEEVVKFLKNKKGKVLDLGCGSGRHFIKSDFLDFYATDFSEKMLELAEKKAKIKLTLKKISNEKIPFKKNFFDYVICISVLHCIQKKERRIFLLKEIRRVLKKEGELLISVWSKNHKKIRNKKKEILIPWKINGKSYNRYYYIYDINELKEELKSVGFSILSEKEDKNIWIIAK